MYTCKCRCEIEKKLRYIKVTFLHRDSLITNIFLQFRYRRKYLQLLHDQKYLAIRGGLRRRNSRRLAFAVLEWNPRQGRVSKSLSDGVNDLGRKFRARSTIVRTHVRALSAQYRSFSLSLHVPLSLSPLPPLSFSPCAILFRLPVLPPFFIDTRSDRNASGDTAVYLLKLRIH